MKLVIALTLLLTLVISNTHPHLDPIINHVPKLYKVDIDEDPLTRWAPIIKDYAEPLKKFMFWIDLIPFSKTFFHDV